MTRTKGSKNAVVDRKLGGSRYPFNTDSLTHTREDSGCEYATFVLGAPSRCLECPFEEDCCIYELDGYNDRRALVMKYKPE